MKTHLRSAMILVALAQTSVGQNAAPVPAAGNVTLPLDQYNQLVERAEQPPKKTDTPPVPYVLKSARLDLQVNGESVAGTASIEGEVLAQGDHKVPLVRGLVIREARQAGRELPVEQEAGSLSALLAGPAPFAVTLDAALPLVIEPGRASFSLPTPQAAAVRLTLSIPGDQTLVNLSPGLITGRSTRDGRTTIEATLVPGQMANLWWAARLSIPQAPAVPKEVRFLSDVKTLISVNEAELAVVALAEVNVVQGEPSQFTIRAPEGFELTGATGPTLVSSETQKDSILLNVSNSTSRNHQFLISLARSNMTASAAVPLITFAGTQRETGEVLIEGDGAMELTATERGVLRRMDLKETSPYLRSLARGTLHTAFRYQKKPAETPEVALEWVRFPNSRMLSAVAQEAVVTTLVTSEGRSLTEIRLTLKNQSQPFLKVDLPPGASILSADVAGEKVKPVQGADGSRVPLLRPGFRPIDSYTVSFVFLHAGSPFSKKGGAELALPKMDLPIGRVQWEVFLPQQYKVADFGGDAVPARLLPLSGANGVVGASGDSYPLMTVATLNSGLLRPGDVGGIITDPARAVVPSAVVEIKSLNTGVTWKAIADRAGRWVVSNLPAGRYQVLVTVPGFKMYARGINHDASRATEFPIALQVGSATESVTVTEEAPLLQTESGEIMTLHGADANRSVKVSPVSELPPSTNVTNLQQRVVGVLPIAVNVPRTGSSYRFVRALAVDEETTLTFHYRTK